MPRVGASHPSASHRRLTALRLNALGIAQPATDDPITVVRDLLALQGQDYAGALWSIGLRTRSATREAVEAAHESGEIVRAWTMRGTLHFVLADDLPWMLSLTGERMVRAADGRRRSLDLDQAQFDRAERIVLDRLADGATASRAELYAAFEEGGLPTTGQRGIHILGQLAQTGLIVLVGQTDWALISHRIPNPRLLERGDALREFALRYFRAHGPATVKDFAWWSSLTLTDARAGLAAARDELVELEVDGATYFHRPGLEPADRAVHLLPGFDEYVLGYTDRSAPLSGAALEVIVPGGNGMFLSTIVVDGEVVGSWRRTQRAKKLELTTAPFDALPAWTRPRIARAAKRYGAFLGQPVELQD